MSQTAAGPTPRDHERRERRWRVAAALLGLLALLFALLWLLARGDDLPPAGPVSNPTPSVSTATVTAPPSSPPAGGTQTATVTVTVTATVTRDVVTTSPGDRTTVTVTRGVTPSGAAGTGGGGTSSGPDGRLLLAALGLGLAAVAAAGASVVTAGRRTPHGASRYAA